jgi:hypothetical protein
MPESDESKDFGWQPFVCSSKDDKMSYLMACLFEDFVQKLNFPYLNTWQGDKRWVKAKEAASKSLAKIKVKLFKKWVEVYLGYSVDSNVIDEFDYRSFGYVDHQSKIRFPMDRSGEYFHHEFIRDFIEQFVSANWYVFGGNDNDGKETPPTKDEKSDFEEFRTLWSFLTDTGEVLCVKDPLTGEYTLSVTKAKYNSGSIIKVKFQ